MGMSDGQCALHNDPILVLSDLNPRSAHDIAECVCVCKVCEYFGEQSKSRFVKKKIVASAFFFLLWMCVGMVSKQLL